MPSQWKKNNPNVNDFNCCKVCSITCLIGAPPDTQRDLLLVCAKLRRIWLYCTQAGWFYRLRQFFIDWVGEDRYTRKQASYYGALKRSRPSDPHGSELRTATDRWGPDDYFDPGNSHYKNCFDALLGASRWNEGTVGDIIESLLGLQFLINHYGLKIQMFPTKMVDFLHDWCLFVYRYCQSMAWEVEYRNVFDRINDESEHVQLSRHEELDCTF